MFFLQFCEYLNHGALVASRFRALVRCARGPACAHDSTRVRIRICRVYGLVLTRNVFIIREFSLSLCFLPRECVSSVHHRASHSAAPSAATKPAARSRHSSVLRCSLSSARLWPTAPAPPPALQPAPLQKVEGWHRDSSGKGRPPPWHCVDCAANGNQTKLLLLYGEQLGDPASTP